VQLALPTNIRIGLKKPTIDNFDFFSKGSVRKKKKFYTTWFIVTAHPIFAEISSVTPENLFRTIGFK
jgi:hypothetical protein